MGRSPTDVVAFLVVMLAVQVPGQVRGEVDNVAFQWTEMSDTLFCSQFGALLTTGIQAQLHLAQWHSLLALRQAGGCTSEEAVVAYASFKVMAHYFPWTQTLDLFLGPLLERQLLALDLTTAEQRLAQRLGEAVAADIIRKRDPDGQFTLGEVKKALNKAKQPPAPGLFRYFDEEDAPGGPSVAGFTFTQLPSYKPFVIPNPADWVTQFFPKMKPPVIPSKEWDENYEGLKDIGRLDWEGRTAEMDLITNLFVCPRAGNTKCSFEQRATTAAKMALPNTTSLYDSVPLLAKISVSFYDATIAQSMFKFGLWFWRPTQAYRLGDPTHPPIPDWKPASATVPEPEFLSGTVAQVSAGAYPLQHFFGKGKKVAFSIPGGGTFQCPGFENTPIPTRNYASLEAFVHEAQLSRMYAGAHFQKSVDDAYILGDAVAKYVEEHWGETTPSGVLPDPAFLDLVYTIPEKSGDYTPPRYDIPA